MRCGETEVSANATHTRWPTLTAFSLLLAMTIAVTAQGEGTVYFTSEGLRNRNNGAHNDKTLTQRTPRTEAGTNLCIFKDDKGVSVFTNRPDCE